ncbi:hypothetical protein [Pseudomonas sp. JBR1]|uniref:hypothetical protein n=1 Tax=Pseudomonas sp. JBR1 TaxID=3020907 RepID=UPI000ED98D0D|nr:hypothetical protein [Pseudomonas sp. JBR1]WCE09343.1 hypothetical protein PJ259_03635 [Pseudomonas sp. JBR1]HAC67262.1 hypothetical protein [Pseudomonas sp.]
MTFTYQPDQDYLLVDLTSGRTAGKLLRGELHIAESCHGEDPRTYACLSDETLRSTLGDEVGQREGDILTLRRTGIRLRLVPLELACD